MYNRTTIARAYLHGDLEISEIRRKFVDLIDAPVQLCGCFAVAHTQWQKVCLPASPPLLNGAVTVVPTAFEFDGQGPADGTL
jgi:hypothetical protein